jgi:ABC-type multidrug transport system fused ATPase/permease subunit
MEDHPSPLPPKTYKTNSNFNLLLQKSTNKQYYHCTISLLQKLYTNSTNLYISSKMFHSQHAYPYEILAIVDPSGAGKSTLFRHSFS